jgi:hypothetical protein
VKNTSAEAVINIYFGNSESEVFSGTGVTLQPGEERTIMFSGLGPFMPFVLA